MTSPLFRCSWCALFLAARVAAAGPGLAVEATFPEGFDLRVRVPRPAHVQVLVQDLEGAVVAAVEGQDPPVEDQRVEVRGLQPGSSYRYRVEARPDSGRTLRTGWRSVQTSPPTSGAVTRPASGAASRSAPPPRTRVALPARRSRPPALPAAPTPTSLRPPLPPVIPAPGEAWLDQDHPRAQRAAALLRPEFAGLPNLDLQDLHVSDAGLVTVRGLSRQGPGGRRMPAITALFEALAARPDRFTSVRLREIRRTQLGRKDVSLFTMQLRLR